MVHCLTSDGCQPEQSRHLARIALTGVSTFNGLPVFVVAIWWLLLASSFFMAVYPLVIVCFYVHRVTDYLSNGLRFWPCIFDVCLIIPACCAK